MLDQEEGLRTAAGKADLADDMLGMLLQSLEGDRRTIREARLAGDRQALIERAPPAWRDALLRVPQLRNACQQSETLLKQNHPDSEAALDELDAAIGRLEQEITPTATDQAGHCPALLRAAPDRSGTMMNDHPAQDAFQHAELDWDENGLPQSRHYGDVYFSRASGLGDRARIRRRTICPAASPPCSPTSVWSSVKPLRHRAEFPLRPATVRTQRQCPARLHFVSVEKHPLTFADMQRAGAVAGAAGPGRPTARTIRRAQSGLSAPGLRWRASGADPADRRRAGMSAQHARIDAWFLDGFAPAKNPQMWQPALFSEMARLSAPGATLGTFTSAGFVRRGLIEAGFDMQRVPGYGHKREILRGRLQSSTAQVADKPWFARPRRTVRDRRAVVIGAGTAGCATAAALAARGWRVSVLERHADAAQEGSGNPQGCSHLKLSAHGTALSKLVVGGFSYTRRLLGHLQQGGTGKPVVCC